MKYKWTKVQIKMLLDGKPIQRNRDKIYASSYVKEVLEIINNNNLYDQYDVFVDDKNNLDVLERKTEWV